MTDRAADETIQTYDRIAAQFAERNFTNVSAAFDACRKMFAREIVGSAPAERFRILDAGCGPGRDSKWFRDKGFQVVGVDRSSGMLAEAKARVTDVDFRQADLRSLDLPDGSFDGIWCCATLLHVPRGDVARVLTSFNRLLGHGYLWLSVKAGDGEESVDGVYGPETPRHFTYFRRHEIELYLERAGFAVQDVAEDDPTELNNHPWIRLFAQTKLSTPLPGAVAVILNHEGQVLLSERADGRGWNLPGGVIDESESPEEAVIRETREETGLVVEVVRLIGIGSWTRPPPVRGSGWRTSVVSNAYLCRDTGGKLMPTTEALRHDWFPPESLPKPMASRWHADAISAAVAATRGRLVWPVTIRYRPLTSGGASSSSPITPPDTQGPRSESS